MTVAIIPELIVMAAGGVRPDDRPDGTRAVVDRDTEAVGQLVRRADDRSGDGDADAFEWPRSPRRS